MTFLTLCFYEYPAAVVHLKFWEEAMKERILERVEINNKTYSCLYYVVAKQEDKEIVYCIRLKEISKITLESLVKDLGEFKHTTYLKTLVFGKVTVPNLNEIRLCLSKIEPYDIRAIT